LAKSENKSLTSNTALSSPDFMPDPIVISEADWDHPVAAIKMSVRLRNVLEGNNMRVLGDLNGLDFEEFAKFKNCGRTSVNELRDLIQRALWKKPFATEVIFIPESKRMRTLNSANISVRLRNVLDAKNFRVLGDLNGLYYESFKQIKNCGRKCIDELRELIQNLQEAHAESPKNISSSELHTYAAFVVPPLASEFLLANLPISKRLEKILAKKAFIKLGDLDGFTFDEMLNLGNCGKGTVKELRELILRAGAGEFSPVEVSDIASVLAQVADSIETGLTALKDRDRSVFISRLIGNDGDPKILEAIAQEFQMTRERVRQIVNKSFDLIHRKGGPKLIAAVSALTRECEQRVCPLTADVFVKWLGDSHPPLAYEPMFYLRVLDTMEQSVPAWPAGSTREGVHEPDSAKILTAVESWMRQTLLTPTAEETYAFLRQQPDFKDLSVGVFLTALRIAQKFTIDFPEVDRPRLRFRRLTFKEYAVPVLEESPEPLILEEILKRARSRFGDAVVVNVSRGVFNVPALEKGLILLGPRSIGLPRHIKAPLDTWPAIRNHFEKMLVKENRPISTTETLAQNKITGFSLNSPHELAHILREDDRFTDLGRHLFGLASWGIQERQLIKDLLPKIFHDANHLLTTEQVISDLSRLRSFCATSLTTIMRKCPEIQPFGFGYYGLKVWGNDKRRPILTDSSLAERAVRREQKPVSFRELCRIFSIDERGEEADLLWQSCASASKLRRVPDQRGPETFLLHNQVSLERTLATLLRTLRQPASPRDLQRQLNANFGQSFVLVGLKELEKRLRQSRLFVCDANGNFSLDAEVNEEEFDPDTLRSAATKILAESQEAMDCDELIERLRLMELNVEDISSDMLETILLGTPALQAVAGKKFQISPQHESSKP
jgi:Bacterial RNA polymerase, alpha chain C terminal domain/Sigma-70, region 4